MPYVRRKLVEIGQFKALEVGELPQAGCEGREVVALQGVLLKLEGGEAHQAGEWPQAKAIPCECLRRRQDESLRLVANGITLSVSLLPVIDWLRGQINPAQCQAHPAYQS